MIDTIISLSTVPERLQSDDPRGLPAVIESLCTQRCNTKYSIHFNIPVVSRITNAPYFVPDWLTRLCKKYPHLSVRRTEDLGPPTKAIPTIQRDDTQDALIIVVDDDLIYHPDMVTEHRKWHAKLPGSVIAYDGRGLVTPEYQDLRDAWVLTVSKPLAVKGIQHYKSASYLRSYFKANFFTEFVGHTYSDDVLMSFYFNHTGRKMIIVPYEPDIPKVQTFDDWHKTQGVETFPVISHAPTPMHTGCNHPLLLEQQPKFFIPDSFKHIYH